MPPRAPFLCPFLRPLVPRRPQLQCRVRVAAGPAPTSLFHSSARCRDDNSFPNHYEMLELGPDATPADIKRQFYALSKKHHPDLARAHPSPSSSENSTPPDTNRFHRINDAYHILGQPESRAKYDRDYHRVFGGAGRHHHRPAHPSGSHSSHSAYTHAGSRPPSGLSKRRSPFRGPPPSFYQQGGYGRTASQRQGRADAEADRAQAEAEPGFGGGFGPGQSSGVFVHGVPHFDREGHRKTHEAVASTHNKSRRARFGGLTDEQITGLQGGDDVTNFVLVSSVIAFIIVVSVWLATPTQRQKREARKAETS